MLHKHKPNQGKKLPT